MLFCLVIVDVLLQKLIVGSVCLHVCKSTVDGIQHDFVILGHCDTVLLHIEVKGGALYQLNFVRVLGKEGFAGNLVDDDCIILAVYQIKDRLIEALYGNNCAVIDAACNCLTFRPVRRWPCMPSGHPPSSPQSRSEEELPVLHRNKDPRSLRLPFSHL